jgi:pentatricopeptide repeat protein
MRALGVAENVVVLTALIKAVGATPGLQDECARLFRRMCRGPARVKPNRGTFRTVIAALREAGDLAGALRVYQGMRRLYPADNREFEGLTAVAGEGRAAPPAGRRERRPGMRQLAVLAGRWDLSQQGPRPCAVACR